MNSRRKFKKDMRGDNMTGYEKIEKALKLDQLDFISDIIVEIECGECVCTELLLLDENFNFYWLNDWWEGEEHVELIGACYVRNVQTDGIELEYKNENY